MDPLLELQRIDTAILRNDHRRTQLEGGGELREVRARMADAEAVLGELRLAIDEVAREQQRLEHEVETLVEKAAHERSRLFGGQVVNPKELESLQREVANIDERRSKLEDELLGILERRDELERRATVASEDRDAARAKADALGGEAEAELVQLAAEREGLAAERVPAAAAVDAEVLALYDDIRAHKQGIGAAELIDSVCQACHERLSALEVERLKKATETGRCEHCRRILVLA